MIKKYTIYKYIYDTRDRYIDLSRHNFENSLLPCFVSHRYMGWPLAGLALSSFERQNMDETIFKIMTGRINLFISSVIST